ncbi:NAD(P)/FAD-dependent oxidoreductase [Spirosoma panaciterrae]|uniref:NAD(P)/FAD-dependent oxidoreductase n=1 Tax=Spirosoma panaciterrae TaxID=496058 RepID=UPI00035C5287|nr:FAD-dependent oxidoreductase [Spirosoma panaciterrae]
MLPDADIVIIGGGLAGLTAGIHLARHNLRVTLFEKQAYPHHKVCGEYISNEVLPYLRQLGVSVDGLNPARIQHFSLSTASGDTIESDLPLGGFAVSRYTLDNHLAQTAIKAGVTIIQDEVKRVFFEETANAFTIETASGKTYHSTITLGAYGKRSLLDKQLDRPFIRTESPWLGVKAHYKAEFPAGLVSLHNFHGGYCGLCQVENGLVNACYLATYDSFKTYKNIDAFQQQVLSQNPHLAHFFSNAELVFEKPLVISQISFAPKQPVDSHILMCGDTAGLIHPLCGNGMAMAIHSAKLVSERLIAYFNGRLNDRAALEKSYTLAWRSEFTKRLTAGRLLQSVLQHPLATSVMLKSLQLTPGLLPLIIKQTHGKPLAIEQCP